MIMTQVLFLLAGIIVSGVASYVVLYGRLSRLENQVGHLVTKVELLESENRIKDFISETLKKGG